MKKFTRLLQTFDNDQSRIEKNKDFQVSFNKPGKEYNYDILGFIRKDAKLFYGKELPFKEVTINDPAIDIEDAADLYLNNE